MLEMASDEPEIWIFPSKEYRSLGLKSGSLALSSKTGVPNSAFVDIPPVKTFLKWQKHISAEIFFLFDKFELTL